MKVLYIKGMSGSIDQIIKDFDLSNVEKREAIQRKSLTFWLPAEYKAKYDMIQSKSKNKFGKLLAEVLKKSIDTVSLEEV